MEAVADNVVKTKIELEGAQKAIRESKMLREELEKLSKSATAVMGQSGGLYSTKSLASNPDLVNALKANSKVMSHFYNGPKAPPVIKNPKDKFDFGNPLNLPGKLGELYSAFTRLHLAFWQLTPIIAGFGIVIAQVTKTMAQGAELYTKAAQIGRNPADLFRARSGGRASGLSPDQIQEMLLKSNAGRNNLKEQGNFNKYSSFQGLQREAMEVMSNISDIQLKAIESAAGKFKNVEIAALKANDQLDIFWMMLSEKMTGAVKGLLDEFSSLLSVINDSGIAGFIGQTLGMAMIQLKKFIEGIGVAVQVMVLTVEHALVRLKNFGRDSKEAQGLRESAGKLLKDFFTKGWNPEDEGRTGNRNAVVGAPLLPAGHWEKLGLSLGGGGAQEYAKQTAENTGKIVQIIMRFLPTDLSPVSNRTNAP